MRESNPNGKGALIAGGNDGLGLEYQGEAKSWVPARGEKLMQGLENLEF